MRCKGAVCIFVPRTAPDRRDVERHARPAFECIGKAQGGSAMRGDAGSWLCVVVARGKGAGGLCVLFGGLDWGG